MSEQYILTQIYSQPFKNDLFWLCCSQIVILRQNSKFQTTNWMEMDIDFYPQLLILRRKGGKQGNDTDTGRLMRFSVLLPSCNFLVNLILDRKKYWTSKSNFDYLQLINNQMQAQLNQQTIKLGLISKLQTYKQVDLDDIKVERMVGITNETFKASVPSHPQIPSVIYRRFGCSKENIFLDRQAERYVYYHIADLGIGPKIFYEGDGIRIQEFIESNILQTNKMLTQQNCMHTAFTLSRFHQMKPDNIPYQSLFQRIFFKRTEQIMAKCLNKLNQNIFNEKQQELVHLFKTWVTVDEINFLKKVTESLQSQPLSFCHNDLLANNILINKATNQFVFIDYEYSGYNYPIFDLGNYINEAQYLYDAEHEPYFLIKKLSEEQIHNAKKMIIAYVVGKQCKTFDQMREKLQKIPPALQSQADKLIELLPIGRMISNLMWGWWGIIVSKNPAIQFDYLAFAKKRYDDYMEVKNSLTN